MISPPKKLAEATLKAYTAYRNAEVHHLPTNVRAAFFERAQTLFKRLVVAMRCEGPEDLMVSENITHMVNNIAPSQKPPRLSTKRTF